MGACQVKLSTRSVFRSLFFFAVVVHLGIVANRQFPGVVDADIASILTDPSLISLTLHQPEGLLVEGGRPGVDPSPVVARQAEQSIGYIRLGQQRRERIAHHVNLGVAEFRAQRFQERIKPAL